jgi:DNA-binding MarR family transcriptional regulator
MLAARLHRTRMAMLLGEIGLFPGQEQALQVLAQNPEGMTMGDLSRTLHVRPPTASKTVSRLSAQGLVERAGASADGRVVRVKLSAAGQDKLARIDTTTVELEKEITALFDGKEAKRLRKSLRRVSRHLGEMVDPEAHAAELLGDDDVDLDDED